ncbi:MAG: VWA domain-containing protein [Candidatus Krumholzibacteriota bacterium]|nr:VWA domain-containing protein [Candidatus Krumholzibacteriota bacterium]
MIEFSNPSWLWGLFLLPVAALALAWGTRRAERETTRFVGLTLRDALAPGHSWRKNLLKGVLRVGALGCLMIALAGPRFGTVLEKIDREGIDIVIALDTSLSMLAEDVPPSRMERARHEIVDLIRGLEGDRVGIVVFAGKAFVLCPLTVDYDAALMFVQSIDVYTVSEPGTALDKAIDASVALFDESKRRDRAIILVTDGENHEGDPHKAAQAAAAKGIRVFTIGIGNPSGELIPERGTDGSMAGYKKDRRGETVLTRLDEPTLMDIASVTGGRYLPATREGFELDVLYREIGTMDRKTIKGEFVERKKERFWILLAAALALLALDGLVTSRATGFRRRGAFLHTGAALFLFCSLSLFPSDAGARAVESGKVAQGNRAFQENEYDKALALYREALGDTVRLPGDYHGVRYNEGNALYMQERYKEAIQRYQQSFSEDSTLTGQMLYNRANALVRSGMLQEAVESYVQSLRYAPDDEQARHNLEMALRILQQQQQEQEQQQRNGDEQSDENREQEQQQQDGDEQSGDGQNDTQQNDESQEQQSDERQNEPGEDDEQITAPPDSSSAAAADSTAMPQPQFSEEDLKKLSREDAMRILQALEEQEKRLQAERRKAAFRRLKRSGKDW